MRGVQLNLSAIFPPASGTTELEKRAVMKEVMAGLLEWGFIGSDGSQKMNEYARAATDRFGGYGLKESEIDELRATSRLWPHFNHSH